MAALVLDQVQLRVGHNASQLLKPENGEYNFVDEKGSTSCTSSYIKMSASAHARLLLSKENKFVSCRSKSSGGADPRSNASQSGSLLNFAFT